MSNSIGGALVNQAEYTLQIDSKNDRYVTQAAKAFVGAPTNAMVASIALVETVLRAALYTAAFMPLYILGYEDTIEALAQSMNDAANATKKAASHIIYPAFVNATQDKNQPDTAATLSKWQIRWNQAKDAANNAGALVKAKAQVAGQKIKEAGSASLDYAKNNKGKIALAAGSVVALGGAIGAEVYFGYPVTNLTKGAVNATVEKVGNFYHSAMQYVGLEKVPVPTLHSWYCQNIGYGC